MTQQPSNELPAPGTLVESSNIIGIATGDSDTDQYGSTIMLRRVLVFDYFGNVRSAHPFYTVRWDGTQFTNTDCEYFTPYRVRMSGRACSEQYEAERAAKRAEESRQLVESLDAMACEAWGHD